MHDIVGIEQRTALFEKGMNSYKHRLMHCQYWNPSASVPGMKQHYYAMIILMTQSGARVSQYLFIYLVAAAATAIILPLPTHSY